MHCEQNPDATSSPIFPLVSSKVRRARSLTRSTLLARGPRLPMPFVVFTAARNPHFPPPPRRSCGEIVGRCRRSSFGLKFTPHRPIHSVSRLAPWLRLNATVIRGFRGRHWEIPEPTGNSGANADGQRPPGSSSASRTHSATTAQYRPNIGQVLSEHTPIRSRHPRCWFEPALPV